MMSKLDTAMFRATANIVTLETREMQTRARELETAYPDLCCVSGVSPSGSATAWKDEQKDGGLYFYYLGHINEEYVKSGVEPRYNDDKWLHE